MILIFGGAYQGKLDYVYENYGKNLSVFDCCEQNDSVDFSKDVINKFHLLVSAQVKSGADSLEYIDQNAEKLRGKIIICDDVSGGIVPLGADVRLWRENVGRSMIRLTKHADEVFRIFCGMGMRLK